MPEASPGLLLLERYELIARVEDRGLGESWSALDRQQKDRPAEVKFLRWSGDELPDDLAEQLKRLRTFRHPLVPAVVHQGAWQSRNFLVYDAVTGESIGTRLARSRAAQRVEELMFLRRVFDQVAAMLGAAHQAPRPILHGALTPASIIVNERRAGAFDAKVLDLALSPWMEPPTDAPARSARLMAPAAPEQTRNAAATERTDVFSLGALLGELLAPPTADGQAESPAPGERLRADVPGAVGDVIARATAIDPAERVSSVAALRVALAEAWKQPVTRRATVERSAPTSGPTPEVVSPESPPPEAPPSDAQPSRPVEAPQPQPMPAEPVYELPELATLVQAPVAAAAPGPTPSAPHGPVDPNAWSTDVIGGGFGAQAGLVSKDAAPRADAAEMLARSRARMVTVALEGMPVEAEAPGSAEHTLLRAGSEPPKAEETLIAPPPRAPMPYADPMPSQGAPRMTGEPRGGTQPAASPKPRSPPAVAFAIAAVLALLLVALGALAFFRGA